jgi:hypothetical protein
VATHEVFEWPRIRGSINANDEASADTRAELRRRRGRHRARRLSDRQKDDVRCCRLVTGSLDIQKPLGGIALESPLDEQTSIARVQSGLHDCEKIPIVLIEEIRQ